MHQFDENVLQTISEVCLMTNDRLVLRKSESDVEFQRKNLGNLKYRRYIITSHICNLLYNLNRIIEKPK